MKIYVTLKKAKEQRRSSYGTGRLLTHGFDRSRIQAGTKHGTNILRLQRMSTLPENKLTGLKARNLFKKKSHRAPSGEGHIHSSAADVAPLARVRERDVPKENSKQRRKC